MLRRFLCQADVVVEFEPIDPILVKSGYSTIDGPDMVPVVTYRSGSKEYYFPGSSLKGVLRSHLERIARTLRPGSVCIPYYDRRRQLPVPVAEERNSYGCGYRSRSSDDSSAQSYADSCAACRLFGSLKFGGRLSISDAYPLPGHQPKLERRNGVGIDRFTGGTVRGVLFDLQALVGGRFAATIRLVNFELWQLAALNLLLADLRDELVGIGSGRSRGMGRVRGTVSRYALSYVPPVATLDGLYQLASDQERQAYGLHEWSPQQPIQLPPPQKYGVRSLFDISQTWADYVNPLAPAFEGFLNWHGGPKGTAS
ncbi:MAG: hypothetical protein KatS3mg110_0250 [Pirellulaceae bacterium]|nr:MAG: hypothetical protein KatS3mg110_0250 [Pirellulaceae bacterium]